MRVIKCPNCERNGTVPDDFPGGRITCPKCRLKFEVAGPKSGGGSSRSVTAVPKPVPVPQPASIYDGLDEEDDVAAPAAPAAPYGVRGRAQQQQPASERSPWLYAGIGGGVLALVSATVLVTNVLRGPADRGAAVVAKNDDQPEPDPTPVSPQPKPDPVATPRPLDSPKPAALDEEAILERLRESTVFIKLLVDGKPFSSGSGFVIETTGNQVLIATNRHVISLDDSDLPPEIDENAITVTYEVVFHSGPGAGEATRPGIILAADSSEDLNRDLAFVLCQDVPRPPRPIDLAESKVPTAGSDYRAAGFPHGQLVRGVVGATGNPGVTLTRGSVSSLLADDYGQLSAIQVDGTLNPGNSGGPLVDAKTGALIGVAVAKLNAESTGFAIPASQVVKALNGRVGACRLAMLSEPTTTADIAIRTELVDPKNRLKEVVVYTSTGLNAKDLRPANDGTWAPLPNAQPLALIRHPSLPEAGVRFQLPLAAGGAGGRTMTFQIAYRDQTGKTVVDPPRTVDLPTGPGPFGNSLEKTIKSLARRSMAKLGDLIDPSASCRMIKDADTFGITISLPGNKIFSLSPRVRQRGAPLHNAPRALTEVNGDFAVIVRVSREMNPGVEVVKNNDVVYRGPDGRTQRIDITYQSAGLVLYQDKDNFMSVERSCRTDPGGATLIEQLTIEVVREGKNAIEPVLVRVPEGDTLIVMVRRNGKVQCLISPTEDTLLVTKELAYHWPETVKVGITATNISRQLFDAKFQQFVIMDNKAAIDEQFGTGDD